MANTYHQIYLQTVFAVKYRNAIIDKQWQNQLYAVVGNLINQSNCKTIIVNGIEDHIHCLFAVKPVACISEVMKSVKARSSKYVNDHNLTPQRFEWQTGYGVFSYRHIDIDHIYKYIQHQEDHHKIRSFSEEYVELLTEFNIPFEKQYVFEDLM